MVWNPSRSSFPQIYAVLEYPKNLATNRENPIRIGCLEHSAIFSPGQRDRNSKVQKISLFPDLGHIVLKKSEPKDVSGWTFETGTGHKPPPE